MSLVGDALRKARREAAARDAERRGVLFSARISEPTARSNLGLGLVLGAVIAVVATVAGGSVAWWLLRGDGSASPGEATAALAGAADPTAAPGGVSPDVAPADRPPVVAPVVPTAVVVPQAAHGTAAEPGAGAPAASTPRPTPAPRPDPSPDTDDNLASDGVPEGFAGIEDGAEVYILEAKLGGTVLSLDYIVSRAEDPFAEINGVEVHLGGVVSGFRVKAIEHDRVVLSDGRRTVELRAP